jgi:aminoglycoside phosphotransferase (APT) family kinase protein
MAKEPNGDYYWLFLQDAGEETYSAQLEEHRLLKAQWLALMHTSAIHLVASSGLPDKGPKQYLKRLRSAREAIQSYLADHHGLQAGDLVPLQSIVAQCDLLESRWRQVEVLCEGLPWTLVHGDFIGKNLRLRQDNGRMALLTFDWGEAGWGTPATDIMQVDTTAYWQMARDNWPWLNGKVIERSAKAGKIFFCLDAIYWELSGLKYEGSGSLSSLGIYESWLADALQAARLEY